MSAVLEMGTSAVVAVVPSEEAVLDEQECAAFVTHASCFLTMFSVSSHRMQQVSGTHCCLHCCTSERCGGTRHMSLQCTSVTRSVCKVVQLICITFVGHLLTGCAGLDAKAIMYVSLSCDFDRTTNCCCIMFSFSVLPFSANQSTSLCI